jgi:hypothetical protein
MRMRYDVVELCSAVRPWFLLHLFNEGFERVAYIDPDILIFRPLTAIESMLDHASTILSPHLTAPLPDDGCLPDERTILQSGAFNSGFIALKNDDAAKALLQWWREKLQRHAHMDTASGLFGDQRWMDLMPGMFERVAILRDPTTNVAYWNLHERMSIIESFPSPDVSRESEATEGLGGGVRGGGLTFFHFSGYKPELPDRLSTHQNRFTLRQIKPLADLCDQYRSLLDQADHGITGQWDYTFDHFENGVPIVPAIRRIFDAIDGERQFPKPFATDNPRSFFRWLSSPVSGTRLPAEALAKAGRPGFGCNGNDGFLMNLHLALHQILIEASARFPDPLHGDRERYAQWLLAWEQEKQFKLPAIFTDSLKPLAATAPRRSLKESTHSMFIRRHDWQPYQTFCRLVRSIIGNQSFERWKPRAPMLEAQPFRAR